MKKILMSTAILVAAAQSSFAGVPDERILAAIEAGLSDVPALCKKLGELPAEDKKRISGLAWGGEAKSEAQGKIKAAFEQNESLENCALKLNNQKAGW